MCTMCVSSSGFSFMLTRALFIALYACPTDLTPVHLPAHNYTRVQLTSNIMRIPASCCGLARLGKSLWVACSDSTLHSYHVKGKKEFSITMPAPIRSIEPLPLAQTRGENLLAVALDSEEVRPACTSYSAHVIARAGVLMLVRYVARIQYITGRCAEFEACSRQTHARSR